MSRGQVCCNLFFLCFGWPSTSISWSYPFLLFTLKTNKKNKIHPTPPQSSFFIFSQPSIFFSMLTQLRSMKSWLDSGPLQHYILCSCELIEKRGREGGCNSAFFVRASNIWYGLLIYISLSLSISMSVCKCIHPHI